MNHCTMPPDVVYSIAEITEELFRIKQILSHRSVAQIIGEAAFSAGATSPTTALSMDDATLARCLRQYRVKLESER